MASSAAAEAVAVSDAVAVDPEIWRAVAGYTVKVPSQGSFAYYFPEGHAEHLNDNNVPDDLPLPTLSQPVPLFLLCRVNGVEFLIDPVGDRVYVKLRLLPLLAPHLVAEGDGFHVRNDGIVLDSRSRGGENQSDDDLISVSKVLTPSDANNGGGFSAPRLLADLVFPLLDFSVITPFQNLVIDDVQGNSYPFRHIYRGTPRRHLLTSGWSNFVNDKKLVAGDTVIFMRKKSTGKLFVGIRKALRSSRGCSWMGQQKSGTENGEGLGFWNKKGKNVVDALELASRGMAFEVEYYPRPGWADFVVKAELVAESMNVPWSGGMRVKLAMETEDSSRLAWCHGTVLSASIPDNGLWFGSPWRMLLITWDEPEILMDDKRISPWQVELIGLRRTSLNSRFPPMKRQKVSHNSPFLAGAGGGGGGDLQFDPMVGGPSSALAQNDTPVGIQGARQTQDQDQDQDQNQDQNQNQFGSSSSFSDITLQASGDDCGNTDTDLNLNMVSNDPNLENVSPNIEKSSSSKSIVLFGKIIHLEEPEEGDSC